MLRQWCQALPELAKCYRCHCLVIAVGLYGHTVHAAKKGQRSTLPGSTLKTGDLQRAGEPEGGGCGKVARHHCKGRPVRGKMAAAAA